MDNLQDTETQSKTIRMETTLIEKIEEMRKGTERNFSQQVKFMLRKYIEFTENIKKWHKKGRWKWKIIIFSWL